MWRDDQGASNAEAVANLLTTLKPDAASLVEVDELWEDPSQIAAIAGATGYSWVFVPAFEFGKDGPVGGFGNAVLTRAPILAAHQRHLLWPAQPYDGSERSEARTAALVKVGIDEGMWVGATHLPRGDAGRRAEAARRLLEIAGHLDGRWVICGDFNMPSTAWLTGTEGFSVTPAPPVPTYPASAPIESIDYALVDPTCRARAEILVGTASDHNAVLLEIEWD